jgi:hypothetical protein
MACEVGALEVLDKIGNDVDCSGSRHMFASIDLTEQGSSLPVRR